MNLHSFIERWDDLAPIARREYAKKFFDYLVNNLDEYDDIVLDFLDISTIYEQDDYFGTEGFQF